MNDLNNDDFVTDVVNEYSDTIYRVALNITKNSADAFDVCQEVFIRLIKNKHKIKDRSHLKAWLLRVAVNCAKSCKTSAYVRHCVPLARQENRVCRIILLIKQFFNSLCNCRQSTALRFICFIMKI